MENSQNIQFKTNINCIGCVASVKPHLDNLQGIGEWEVNTSSKDKVLTVKTGSISMEEVIQTVQKAGFKIETLNN